MLREVSSIVSLFTCAFLNNVIFITPLTTGSPWTNNENNNHVFVVVHLPQIPTHWCLLVSAAESRFLYFIEKATAIEINMKFLNMIRCLQPLTQHSLTKKQTRKGL